MLHTQQEKKLMVNERRSDETLVSVYLRIYETFGNIQLLGKKMEIIFLFLPRKMRVGRWIGKDGRLKLIYRRH